MTPHATVIIDGRELTALSRDAFYMVERDHISLGRRRWQPDRTPPEPYGWHWMGEATNGEHLYWMPVPAEPASSEGT